MKLNTGADRSRLIATAESLQKFAPDAHCFTEKEVLLTGEPKILATENGRSCFLNGFRLLTRMVANLTVHISEPSELIEEVRRECSRIANGNTPKIQTVEPIDYRQFVAILSVGATARPELPWTVINSHGWIARVSSRGQDISPNTGQANPIAALGAACIGVAEVFKRLISLRPSRGEMASSTSFSFLTYSQSQDPGPEIPTVVQINLALFGAGAIGNGIIHLLECLPVSGFISIIDRQVFRPENWGTCLLIGPKDFEVPKAEWAANWLKIKLDAKPFSGSVEQYVEKCGRELIFPELVLNGLDNIPARRMVQSLWPGLIIDGAIGATACEVTLHPWGVDRSCLMCDFEEPEVAAEEVQQRASGLRAGRLTDIQSVITEEDIELAPAEKRDWLRERKGKQICSVISEAVLSFLSAEAHKPGFEPSVPFVACLSSCMVVTEMVRHAAGWPQVLTTGFQFDSLVGPQNGLVKFHRRKPGCICVTRRASIEAIRLARWKVLKHFSE